MQAGTLRHRLEIHTNTTTTGNTGQAKPSWARSTTVWGRLSPLNGRELMVAREVTPEVTHKIEIRADATLTEQDKFILQGTSREFHILSIRDIDERGIKKIIMVKEHVGQST